MKFKPTNDQQMKLTLSNDRKIITLGMVNDDKKLMMLAWHAKNLKPLRLPPQLEANLLELPLPEKNMDYDRLKLQLRYIGRDSSYLMVQYQNYVQGGKSGWLQPHFYLFHGKTGDQVFKFWNDHALSGDLKCCGVLPFNHSHEGQEDRETPNEDRNDEYSESESDEEEKKNGLSERSAEALQTEGADGGADSSIELVFVFVSVLSA